jgi:hypothetical protein
MHSIQYYFKYQIGSKEHLLFEQKIKQDPIKLNFRCSITARAQIKKTNTFTISLKDINDFRLSDKLFGPANESFVTREQLNELSGELYSYFNVVEDYQMPQDQFNSTLVVHPHHMLKVIRINDQLKELNTYSENKIRYEFEGNRIVPKSIQVSKLQASSFKQTLNFSRI